LPAAYVRDLRGVIEREKAAIGCLITMEAPTKKMREEAASAGVYTSGAGTSHPRLQILTRAASPCCGTSRTIYHRRAVEPVMTV
jgi:hypothetical protein